MKTSTVSACSIQRNRLFSPSHFHAWPQLFAEISIVCFVQEYVSLPWSTHKSLQGTNLRQQKPNSLFSNWLWSSIQKIFHSKLKKQLKSWTCVEILPGQEGEGWGLREGSKGTNEREKGRKWINKIKVQELNEMKWLNEEVGGQR